MSYSPNDREIALLRVTFDHPAGTSRWIEAQQGLHDTRLERAQAMVGDDPYDTPQSYWQMVDLVEMTYDKLVKGCVALSRRSGIAEAVHQIRAADIDEFSESLLLDVFTRSAY